MTLRIHLSLFLAALLSAPLASAQTYTNEADDAGLDVAGNKEGGVAFGDLNSDGCLDAVANTFTTGSHVFLQERTGGRCTGDFADRTSDVANGMTSRRRERSVIVADLNQDGSLDLVVNTFPFIDIYYNDGAALPSFGNAMQNPSQTISAWIGETEINSEGITVADYDGDGDLDLAVESHEYGIKLLRQTAGVFVEEAAALTGLPDFGNNGDYAAAADLNTDGFVDFVMRRHNGSAGLGQRDLWFGTGMPNDWFIPSTEVAEVSSNSAKGAVAICDFNNDGRLDVFWSPGIMYFQDATAGDFTRSTTWDSPNVTGTIRGATCFDADNDGDQDLFLSGTAGTRHLYLNNGSGAFTRNNLGISGAGEGLGAIAADYDRDGDLDLYVNSDVENELFVQSAAAATAEDYLAVWAQHVNGDGSRRAAHGGTFRLETCRGAGFGPRYVVDAGGGRGSMTAGPTHAGLGAGGRADPVIVAVRFPNSTRTVRRAVQPDRLSGYQEFFIAHTDGSNTGACSDRDGDMVLDFDDPDDDNDGVLDADELGGTDLSGDSDGDMIPDWQDPSIVMCTDTSPRDGVCDTLPMSVDADGDGVPNHFDLDSDNDGLYDTVESGSGFDANFDGVPDSLTDRDGDGLIDVADAGPGNPANVMGTVMPTSSDMDGLPDFLDRDSDDDGLTDTREAGAARDSNGDGVPDNCTAVDPEGRCNAGSLSEEPRDTDGTLDDYIDPDSDGDGLLDRVEAFDLNGDGTIGGAEQRPSGDDDDGDGIDDAFDADDGGMPVTDPLAGFRDENADGVPDWRTTCGDEYVRGAEACDDGNRVDGDECSNMCLLGIGEDCRMGGMCDSAFCAPDGTCQVCGDTMMGMGVDAGCTADAPACVTTAGVAACVGCTDDSAAGGTDQGCTDRAPLCDTAARTCRVCVDAGVGVVDTGCDGAAPVCNPAGLGACRVCEDTEAGTRPDDVDFGCGGAGEGPFCDTSGRTPSCAECLTAAQCDDGVECTTDVCSLGACSNDDRPLGTTCDGVDACDGMGMCVECVNDDAAPRDSGCMAGAPFCLGPDDGAGMCVECLADDDCDAGESCSAANTCATGCDDDDDCPGADVCETDSRTCVPCIDVDGVPDRGCTDEMLPVCRGAMGVGTPGSSCVECTEDSHCGGGDVCETRSNLCVTCFDDGPGNDPGCSAPRAICDTSGAEEVCVECLEDADCRGGACGADNTCDAPDNDGDGVPDAMDIDDDNDGIPDDVEGGGTDYSGDADGDGVPDYADPDAVSCTDMGDDGVCDTLPSEVDLDGDGVPNHFDLDADGDGIPDETEGHDANGDGLPDTMPPLAFADADGDGLHDVYDADSAGLVAAAQDFDGDSAPDFLDVDSDDDAIPDRYEAFDIDGDGEQDVLPSGMDVDLDGLDDAFDPDQGGAAPMSPDVDDDGKPEYLDVDSDADGIRDDRECRDPTACPDTDGDGRPDQLDVDADGDGIPDAIEGHDADGDGVADVEPSGTDADDDGLDDAFDPSEGGTQAPEPDEDLDGAPDYQDVDDDDDGVLSAGECPDPDACPDTDGDGVPDYLDVDSAPDDSDMDGLPDVLECGGDIDSCPDTDGDGDPDHQDNDDDGDGVPTAQECRTPSTCDVDGDGDLNHLDIDSDDDGIRDAVECTEDPCEDTDDDGTPDYQDVDADSDGIPDRIEGHDADRDGAADVAPSGDDADGDGLDDAYDDTEGGADAVTPDSDGDSTPDWRDVDDDDDGVPTASECRGGLPCPDGDDDSMPDYLDVDGPALDTDMDGIPDVFECPPPLSGDSCPDSDGDGDPDFDDPDDDNDGIPTADENYDGNGDPSDDDTDQDGIPDYLDVDDDNDGIPTEDECTSFEAGCADADGDGAPDYLDVCGDGQRSAWSDVTTWEECDDGNTTLGDGCDATCRFDGSMEPDDDMDESRTRWNARTGTRCDRRPASTAMETGCPTSTIPTMTTMACSRAMSSTRAICVATPTAMASLTIGTPTTTEIAY